MAEGILKTWALVELMGHRRIAGHVVNEELLGTRFLRVEVPDSESDPAKMVTQFYGSSAVYCITPVSEEVARAFALAHRVMPVQQWELERPALPANSAFFPDADAADDTDVPDGDEAEELPI
jgi:hypothetical protein